MAGGAKRATPLIVHDLRLVRRVRGRIERLRVAVVGEAHIDGQRPGDFGAGCLEPERLEMRHVMDLTIPAQRRVIVSGRHAATIYRAMVEAGLTLTASVVP